MSDEAIHLLGLPKKHANDHRAWNLSDEFSWSHLIRVPRGLPVKSASNPIIGPRAGKWDSGALRYIDISRYGNYFYLWYCAGPTWRIGVARASLTGFPTTWERFDNPIISLGASGAFDDVQCISPDVVLDFDAGEYQMFYEGYDGAVYRLGLATCPLTSDPTVAANWTKSASNPLTFPAAADQAQGTLKLGNLYWMQYKTTANLLNVATSNSKTGPFTDRGNIVALGETGSWDASNITLANVFWNQGIFYDFYSGSGVGLPLQIGLALSANGFGAFTKELWNPVIPVGAAGAWDDAQITSPAIIMVNEKFYIFYCGWGGAGTPESIGVATIP